MKGLRIVRWGSMLISIEDWFLKGSINKTFNVGRLYMAGV